MYQIHITNEGKPMMICEMEDRHLMNTINLHLRRLTLVVEKARSSKPLDRYEQALYGYQQVSPEQAAQLTKLVADKIAPYMLEAVLRGVLPEEMTTKLQKAFGRKGRIMPPPEAMMLKSGEVVHYQVGDLTEEDMDWEQEGRDPEEGDR